MIYSAHWDHLGIGAARCKRRQNIQWRSRQRHRHGRADRARPRVCARAKARALGDLPQCDRRGKGPARFGILRGQSAVSARQDRRRHQYGRARSDGTGAQFLHVRQRAVGIARCADRRCKAQVLPSRPIRIRKPATSSAPIISRSPSAACRRCRSSSGDDLVNGGKAAGEAAHKEYVANHYHQPADEWQASWTFAGMAHDLAACCTSSAAIWPIRDAGRTGRRIPSSARRATRARLSGIENRPKRSPFNRRTSSRRP